MCAVDLGSSCMPVVPGDNSSDEDEELDSHSPGAWVEVGDGGGDRELALN